MSSHCWCLQMYQVASLTESSRSIGFLWFTCYPLHLVFFLASIPLHVSRECFWSAGSDSTRDSSEILWRWPFDVLSSFFGELVAFALESWMEGRSQYFCVGQPGFVVLEW